MTARDFRGAYIAIKVSSQQELPLETVIRCMPEVVRLLEESTIILDDIDISVDCAFISTRVMNKDYLSKLGVTESDIAHKVKDVGLNCISWRGYTTSVPPVVLRTKIYYKLVQMLESTDVRSSLGSQSANLIMNPCPLFAQKLRSFSGSGMSRTEITFYSSTVYDASEYELIIHQTLERMSRCPTFEISFERQWRAVTEEIRRFFAVYIRDTRTSAYCNWWNSITGKKQGMSRSNIEEKDVIPLLSNFSFNNRPVHCLTLTTTASEEDHAYAQYELIHYRCYNRETLEMTLIPALNNSLYPFRWAIPNVPSFESIGLVESNDIMIEWPWDCLFKASNVREASVISTIRRVHPAMDSIDFRRERQSNDGRLFVMENYLGPSDYRPDYKILEEQSSCTFIGYGETTFKGRSYICLLTDDDLRVICNSRRLSLLV
ncbi:hypothetical protein VTP01DRAFT_6005 [Rhizomucor pusillus]|uniref:uncharacterized protein n=1 Tax=Rhizomucor pusillus TaxID=4840 RepID=UPI0037438B23